jgi:hypothetical protein
MRQHFSSSNGRTVMKRSFLLSVVIVCGLAGSVQAQFLLDNSGLIGVNVIRIDSNAPGNNTPNWLGVWNALDGGAGPTGSVVGRNVQFNLKDFEVDFNYGGGGNFGGTRSIQSINNNGPGGTGGVIGPGEGDGAPDNASNYSVRAQTYLQFTQGGTYTIAMGSDDGRLISLTEALPGSAPGYTGFTARNGQFGGGNPAGGFPASFTPGDTEIGFSDGTGVNQTLGTFNVAAGDILALDAFYYEGTGGDAGEISLAQGSQTAFSTATFQLLTDNMFNGAVQLSTSIQQVPEPAAVVIWSIFAVALGFVGYRRIRRRNKNLGHCWIGK